MKIFVLNPMTQKTKNVVRDVVYGCWCNGKRIGGAVVPPFNLIVITSYLRQNNFDADFLDAQAEQITPQNMALRVKNYDVVIISTSTMSFREDANYLLELKKSNPGLQTIILGSHPTFMPKYCLAHEGVDFIIKHEPEFILKDLMGLLASGQDYRGLKGIGFRENEEIVINEDYPLVEDLDQLPFPDIDLLPKGMDYYNPLVRRMPYMTTSTSRGCPGQCIFCTAPAFDGHVLRFQSADYVIREIEYMIKKGIKEIYFRDDTFFLDRKRDSAICEYIIKNKLDITWIANARVNLLDEGMLMLAKRAGCHTIKFGIESGVQEILDGIKKGYRVEQAIKIFALAHKHGVKTHAHVMLGNPGETKETIEKTIKFVLDLDPVTATFGICTPYPGTPLFTMIQDKCPEIVDGSSVDLSKLHVSGLFNEHYTSLKRDELAKAVPYAYRRFYLRPHYWLKSLRWQIQGLNDVKRLSIAATNIFNFIASGEN